MNDQQIKEFLRDEFPWYLTDASVSLLRGVTTVDELRSRTATLGRDMKLIVNPEYDAAVEEYRSIYAFEEFHGESSRQKIYREKKARDEKREIETLRAQLRNVHLSNAQGEHRRLETLTLSELRQAVADIAEHKRMKSMSAGDLRAEQAAKNPAPIRRADGYSIMPRELVVPQGVRVGDKISDGMTATTMTPDVILRLAKSPVQSEEYHFYRFRLVRTYGAAQVTERQRSI